MKKVLLFIVIFSFVGVVSAKRCEVISGSGKAIGDEVKCGTESFYVVKSDEEYTKLLTKYNLYVGDIINVIEADENAPQYTSSGWTENPVSYCMNLGLQHGFDPDSVFPMGMINYETISSCRIYERIDDSVILQKDIAVGTFLENGKSKLPLYGITYMLPQWNIYPTSGYNEYDDNGNLIVEGSDYEVFFNGYGQELENQDIEVEDVSFLTLNGFIELLKTISNEEVEVELEYPQSGEMTEQNNPYLGKMDVKKYIPEKYKWLYDRTYWLGSGSVVPEVNHSGTVYSDYYVSNEGILCALGRDVCLYFRYPIGNGVRPVVTIANNNIKYTYKFIEGMGQDFNIVSNNNMKFKINMEYEDFVKTGKIFIDDEEVDCNCYELSKGSTVVTFKDECSKKYRLGEHSIRATLNDGQYEAITDFIISSDTPIVSKVKQIIDNPNTSDKMVIFVFVSFTSLIIICAIVRKKLFSSRYESV